jgi:hypothetical protein
MRTRRSGVTILCAYKERTLNMPPKLPPRKEPRRKPGEADQKDSKGGGKHEQKPADPKKGNKN